MDPETSNLHGLLGLEDHLRQVHELKLHAQDLQPEA